MPDTVRSIRLLYATATGTAGDVARNLEHRLHHVGAKVLCCSTLDDYAFHRMPTHGAEGCLFIFIVATAGDGEAPRTMSRFWTALRNSTIPKNTLCSVQFAIFGLGDRSYPKFNAAARRLSTRMRDLGANLVIPLSLGDDSEPLGYEGALATWTRALTKVLAPAVDDRPLLHTLPPLPPRWHLEQLSSTTRCNQLGSTHASDLGKWGPSQAQQFYTTGGDTIVNIVESRAITNKILTNSDVCGKYREVRHIELDITLRDSHEVCKSESPTPQYDPGDVINILPRNRSSAVRAFLEMMNFDGNTTVNINLSAQDLSTDAVHNIDSPVRHVENEEQSTRASGLNIRTPCRLDDFVSAQLDLNAMPRRNFLERLANFASDKMQRAKLLELCSPEETSSFLQYVYREKRTVLMVLRDFPSARPPLDDIVDMIPRLCPRAYSIASSKSAHGNIIHICASIVRYETPLKFLRVGVCSSFWLGLTAGDIVPVYFTRGSLKFDKTIPSLLIGPGTGVAPMRSFVSSLDLGRPGEYQKWQSRLLYFGCRYAKGDFLYEDEWVNALSSRRLTRVRTAFSRDGPSKVYVQDKLEEDAPDVWDLLARGGSIYVAGASGGMPKGVRLAITKAVKIHGGMNDQDAESFVKRLETTRRYQVECW